jgi:hypothetical protein
MVRPFGGSSGTDFAIYKLLAVISSYRQFSSVIGSFQQLLMGIGSYMQLPTVTVR